MRSAFLIGIVVTLMSQSAPIVRGEHADYLKSAEVPGVSAQKVYCGAYVVWYALYFSGKTRPIGALVEDLQLDKEHACTVADVCMTLEKEGVHTRAVTITRNQIGGLRSFIPLLGDDRALGHFVYCRILAGEKVAVWDGINPVQIRNMYEWFDGASKREWSGAAVVLDQGPTWLLGRWSIYAVGLSVCGLAALAAFRRSRAGGATRQNGAGQ